MVEFLTENARRAYPLDGEWPSSLRERWTGVLVDACVYAAAELGDARIKLLSVQRYGSSLRFTVGVSGGASLVVTAAAGLGGFTTVYAVSSALKALLTVDGRRVDALALDTGYTASAQTVGVPFAVRCCGGAPRRVTSVTAQGAAACETPQYSAVGPHRVEKSVGSNAHAVLEAKDGVDLEVTGMAPLAGNVLRISAIAAPEAAEPDEEPVDMMIRGDACVTVEAIPTNDGATGVIKIGNACKPCCQCEDYRDAADMLHPAETEAWRLNGELDAIEADYRQALAVFAAAKAAAEAAVNSLDNVTLTMSVAGSGGLYGGSNAQGTRQRVTATLLIRNMTMLTADVEGVSIPAPSGWAPVNTAQSGSTSMAPGETRMVVKTFRKTASANSNTVSGLPTVTGSCTVTLRDKNAVVASDTKTASA